MRTPQEIGLEKTENYRRSLWQSEKPSTFAMRVGVALTVLFLLATAFRTGWTTQQTDFPNYYTAAKLVREGKPLREYYDWTWFAREMNRAGNDTLVGAYTPQTPLTMLPMVPFAGLSVQRAKQIWLVGNFGFLLATVWLLARVTRFNFAAIWLLACCGYFSLRTNFWFGQYYVFLLFLLTLAFYLLDKKRLLPGGVVAGVAFAVKLYGGPFLFYFAARRQWRAVVGMLVATACLLGIAIWLFGAADIHYYATQILPRSLEGGSIDPYNPGLPTFSTMLRHTFVREVELNPHPVWQAPWLFFFLRSLISLAVMSLLFLGTSSRRSTPRHDFAWFVIGAVLLSTSTASYTFIVLLLPLVLLLEESEGWRSVVLIATYILLTLPLHPVWLFPKVWLLLALFAFVGYPNLLVARRSYLVATAVAVVLFSCVDARRHMASYREEPGQRLEHAVVQHGALLSSFPVVSRAGLFYQSMGKDRYLLRWVHDQKNEELRFDGQALHPRLATDAASIDFELAANGASRMMRFDPVTRKATVLLEAAPSDAFSSPISPDGKWIAFQTTGNDPTQIGLRNISDRKDIVLTSGDCNNVMPAWELDSKAIVFASDCGRAWGLPALYRVGVPDK